MPPSRRSSARSPRTWCRRVRSTGFGVLAAVNGLGDLVASVAVGALWTAISPAAAFSFSLAVTAAGTVAIALALRRGED